MDVTLLMMKEYRLGVPGDKLERADENYLKWKVRVRRRNLHMKHTIVLHFTKY